MEAMKEIVQKALPCLSAELLQAVVDLLADCGVQQENDMILIKESDLTMILNTIQARKLVLFIKGSISGIKY